MPNKINDKWELRVSFNSIRRYLCNEVNQFTIDRLRLEFKYALNKLDVLEKDLRK